MTHQNCVPVRHLFTINHIESLEEKTIVHREAVRAIIRNKDKVLLIRSRKFGEYKFPGGGIDVGESMLDALRREVKEETGYDMNPAILSFGRTIEFHPDFAKEFDVFHQTSDYFICSIFGSPSSTEYAEYEIEYGYYPEWVRLEDAYMHNLSVPKHPQIPWNERDTRVMGMLLSEEHDAN